MTGALRIERMGYVVSALLFVSGLIHLMILFLTGGSWVGPLSLRKPATFGLSFGLTLMTITWVTTFLRIGDRVRTRLLGVFAAACVLETALVTLQAWRGVPSHFNVETSFDASVTRLLAGGGVTLIAIVIAFTVYAFRQNPSTPVSLRVAIQAGFVILIGSLTVGALMIAKGMTLVVNGNPQAAYATGGSLKPMHAATMHAILILPGLAWLMSFSTWSDRRRLRVVLAATASYLVFLALLATIEIVNR